jgi:hypothetical protein
VGREERGGWRIMGVILITACMGEKKMKKIVTSYQPHQAD